MESIKDLLFGKVSETFEARALAHRSQGPFFTTIPVTVPAKSHEIVVEVKAVGLNPVDYKLSTRPVSYFLGTTVIGLDYAGVVEWAGHDTEFKKGDWVFGMTWIPVGTAATHVVVDTVKCCAAKIPDSVAFEAAAGVPLVFGTAFTCLSFARLEPGCRVLILGGNTATGHMALQLAKKHFKASYVLATCSSASKPQALSLGADETVDYRKDGWAQAIAEKSKHEGKFNVVFDCVGGTEVIDVIDDVLLPRSEGSAYASIVGDRRTVVDGRYSAIGGLSSVFSFPRTIYRQYFGHFNYYLTLVSPGKWIELARDMLAREDLKVVLDSVHSWDNWQNAWDKLASGSARGKIIMKIS